MQRFVLASAILAMACGSQQVSVLPGAGPDKNPSPAIYGGSAPDAPEPRITLPATTQSSSATASA